MNGARNRFVAGPRPRRPDLARALRQEVSPMSNPVVRPQGAPAKPSMCVFLIKFQHERVTPMTRTAASTRSDRGAGGPASPGRVTAGGLWARLALVFGLMAAALVAQPVYACATVGVCGTRTIDGNPSDWNLTKDLYTSMREAGRTDKSQLGNF